MLSLAVASISTVLDVGLTPLLFNRLSAAHGRGAFEEFRRYSSVAATLALGLGVFACVTGLVALDLDWARLLKLKNPAHGDEARWLFGICIFFSIGLSAMSPIESIFCARLQLTIPRLLSFVAAVLGLGGLLIGVWLRLSLPVLALLTSGVSSLYRWPLLLRLMRDKTVDLRPNFRVFKRALRELLPSSSVFAGIQISATAMSMIPPMWVARYFGLGEVATFSIASRLLSLPIGILGAALPNFWPAFTVAWVRKDRRWISHSVFWACTVTTFLLGAYVAIVTLIGPWFVVVWTQNRVIVGWPLLLALGLGAPFQGLVYWLSTFLTSINDFTFELASYATAAVCTCVCAATLAPRGSLLALCLALSLSGGPLLALPLAVRARSRIRKMDSGESIQSASMV
jgi:O-antigen/teichoic acid export membrane protein